MVTMYSAGEVETLTSIEKLSQTLLRTHIHFLILGAGLAIKLELRNWIKTRKNMAECGETCRDLPIIACINFSLKR